MKLTVGRKLTFHVKNCVDYTRETGGVEERILLSRVGIQATVETFPPRSECSQREVLFGTTQPAQTYKTGAEGFRAEQIQ